MNKWAIIDIIIPWRRAWQPTPVFLPGESPWTEETDGLHSQGHRELNMTWSTKHSTVDTIKGYCINVQQSKK